MSHSCLIERERHKHNLSGTTLPRTPFVAGWKPTLRTVKVYDQFNLKSGMAEGSVRLSTLTTSFSLTKYPMTDSTSHYHAYYPCITMHYLVVPYTILQYLPCITIYYTYNTTYYLALPRTNLHYHTLPYNTLPYITLTLPCISIPCNTTDCLAIPHTTFPYHFNTFHYPKLPCNPTHYLSLPYLALTCHPFHYLALP